MVVQCWYDQELGYGYCKDYFSHGVKQGVFKLLHPNSQWEFHELITPEWNYVNVETRKQYTVYTLT